MNSERIQKLRDFLNDTDFYNAPSSRQYHGSYPGGLAKHSDYVFLNLLSLTERMGLQWQEEDSPYIVAMGHDVCKIGLYVINDGKYEYNTEHAQGHGDLSVKMLKDIIELTPEEEACIRWHMGAFDDSKNWGEYTTAIHKFPNVLWTHTADMMAAHIDEI